MIIKKHLDFIDMVSKGSPLGEAYTLCVGRKGITKKSSQAKASQLAKKYAKEIQEKRDKYQEFVDEARKKEVVENALKKILTQAEVDAKLCSIINSECEVDDVAFFMGEPTHFKRKPTVNEIATAVKIYYQRYGSNAPAKTDLNIVNIPAPIIQFKGESE